MISIKINLKIWGGEEKVGVLAFQGCHFPMPCDSAKDHRQDIWLMYSDMAAGTAVAASALGCQATNWALIMQWFILDDPLPYPTSTLRCFKKNRCLV